MDEEQMRRPVDALDHAIHMGFVSSTGYKTPGYIVSNLDSETRAALQELTSDQALSMRPVLLDDKLRRRGRFNG